MIKEWFARIKEVNTIKGTICHYTAHFKTIDNVEHTYSKFRYGAPDKITCALPDYIMSYVREDGYLKDDNGLMYPLQNIISIQWECDDILNDIELKEYQIFYDKPIDNI